MSELAVEECCVQRVEAWVFVGFAFLEFALAHICCGDRFQPTVAFNPALVICYKPATTAVRSAAATRVRTYSCIAMAARLSRRLIRMVTFMFDLWH